MAEKLEGRKIYGIPVLWFLFIFALTILGIKMEIIQDVMMGGFTISLILGVGFTWLGDQIPVIKEFGAGTIFAVLIPSILIYIGFLPQSAAEIGKNFFSGYDFSSFLVPSLLIGSILAMDKRTLINAGIKFIIPMVGTIVLATSIAGLIGMVLGYGLIETMLYIAGPILGAGVSASAVPLSEIYASYGGGNSESYLTVLTSSVMIANVLTILSAALLNSLGRKNPNMFIKGFSGEGKILRNDKKVDISKEEQDELVKDSDTTKFSQLRIGFILTCGFYVFGRFCNSFVPALHTYVWMIIPAIIVKVCAVMPKEMEISSGEWTQFMAKVMTPAVLAAISLGVLDIGEVVVLFTNPIFVVLCVVTVVVTLLVSGLLTYLFGFYLVEGAIMAGLGLADMGGTGDVAVLSASDRMQLLPFLTICSRIGGAINMVWLTFLASTFL